MIVIRKNDRAEKYQNLVFDEKSKKMIAHSFSVIAVGGKQFIVKVNDRIVISGDKQSEIFVKPMMHFDHTSGQSFFFNSSNFFKNQPNNFTVKLKKIQTFNTSCKRYWRCRRNGIDKYRGSKLTFSEFIVVSIE